MDDGVQVGVVVVVDVRGDAVEEGGVLGIGEEGALVAEDGGRGGAEEGAQCSMLRCVSIKPCSRRRRRRWHVLTNGDLDSFMVASSYGAASPVVETADSRPHHVFGNLRVFQVVNPGRHVLGCHGCGSRGAPEDKVKVWL